MSRSISLKPGDVLRYRVAKGCFMAGSGGLCRINHFEGYKKKQKYAQTQYIVYLDVWCKDHWSENMSRHWPYEIEFADLFIGEFIPYI